MEIIVGSYFYSTKGKEQKAERCLRLLAHKLISCKNFASHKHLLLLLYLRICYSAFLKKFYSK